MYIENWEEFINKAKEEYKNIGYIKCPAFDYEYISFGREGFNHLLWKGKVRRSRSEQVKRILLMPKAVTIISTSTEYQTFREEILLIDGNYSTAYFWSFKTDQATVVVRKINNGKKHFFSVIPGK